MSDHVRYAPGMFEEQRFQFAVGEEGAETNELKAGEQVGIPTGKLRQVERNDGLVFNEQLASKAPSIIHRSNLVEDGTFSTGAPCSIRLCAF